MGGGIWPGWWCRVAGCLRRPVTRSSRTGWSMRTGQLSGRSRCFCGTCRRAGGRKRRSGRTGWTCCGGSGSCGRRGAWDQATRVEARDFCRWIQLAAKPAPGAPGTGGARVRRGGNAAVNPVTGKPAPAVTMRPRPGRTPRPCCGPFTTSTWRPGPGRWSTRSRWRPAGGRAHAHHNPMEPFRRAQRPVPSRGWSSGSRGSIPDEKFDELFAGLRSHRDRALVAFWVSTGARASELLGVLAGDADPGQQLITVIRKGTRAVQQLPASPDAFVWLRLYQQQMQGLVPAGPDQPLWWTLPPPVPAAVLSRRPGRCSLARTGAGRELDACMTCGILLRTGWPGTRSCRSPTLS